MIENSQQASHCAKTLDALENVIVAIGHGGVMSGRITAIVYRENLNANIIASINNTDDVEDALSDMNSFHRDFEEEFNEWVQEEAYGKLPSPVYRGSCVG